MCYKFYNYILHLEKYGLGWEDAKNLNIQLDFQPIKKELKQTSTGKTTRKIDFQMNQEGGNLPQMKWKGNIEITFSGTFFILMQWSLIFV